MREKGEQAFIQAARRADIEQAGVETQVFSQIVDIVDELDDQEGVNILFGTDQAAMQMVLDGLNVGKIQKPAEQIAFVRQKHDSYEAQYGSMTLDTISHYIERLPVTDSLLMLQADAWRAEDYAIQTPHRSQSYIYYRTRPNSDLYVAATCSVRYGVDVPEWDLGYAVNVMAKADGRDKMCLVGEYLDAVEEDDQVFMPEKRFGFAILKAADLRHQYGYYGFVNYGPVVSKVGGSYDYQNGRLVQAPDPWDD